MRFNKYLLSAYFVFRSTWRIIWHNTLGSGKFYEYGKVNIATSLSLIVIYKMCLILRFVFKCKGKIKCQFGDNIVQLRKYVTSISEGLVHDNNDVSLYETLARSGISLHVVQFYCVMYIIRNTWKGLKFGVGEEWSRPVGPIVWEIKKYYTESRRRRISYIK
jgi:hypothetical protein